jgi:poly-D-alanine transfer protein DltD
MSLSINQNTNQNTIQNILENEILTNGNEKKHWNKLDKMSKIEKLYDYVDTIQEKEQLTTRETLELKQYLRTCIDRKKIQKAKEIIYDKETGTIKDIPILQIIKKGPKRFTLKQLDKKDSTLKNLSLSRKNRIVPKLKKKETELEADTHTQVSVTNTKSISTLENSV